MNVQILAAPSGPGEVVIVFVPGEIVPAKSAGALTITTPLPPSPP